MRRLLLGLATAASAVVLASPATAADGTSTAGFFLAPSALQPTLVSTFSADLAKQPAPAPSIQRASSVDAL